jgi:hypothetical protein
MKVLDLQCEHQHVFEGWFGSEEDYLDQHTRGLVSCPLCANANITKRLSAPRLNFGKTRESAHENARDVPASAQTSVAPGPVASASNAMVAVRPPDQAMVAAWLEMTKKILANTDDVGDKFADEARKIHYGETEERSIRGKASADETRALLEEGITVMPLFVPEALKGTLQ